MINFNLQYVQTDYDNWNRIATVRKAIHSKYSGSLREYSVYFILIDAVGMFHTTAISTDLHSQLETIFFVHAPNQLDFWSSSTEAMWLDFLISGNFMQ